MLYVIRHSEAGRPYLGESDDDRRPCPAFLEFLSWFVPDILSRELLQAEAGRLSDQPRKEWACQQPKHNPIRVKTLSSILKNIAQRHKMSGEELLRKLDL